MGNAFSAVADDASANTWNPAGLTGLPNDIFQIQTTYHRDIGSTEYGYLLFGSGFTERIGLGITLATLQTKSIKFYDIDGNRHVVPGEADYLLGVAMGYKVKPWLGVGSGAKFMLSNLGGGFTANTFAFDFGIRAKYEKKLVLLGSLLLKDAFGRQKFLDASVPVRTTIRAGFAVIMNHHKSMGILTSADAEYVLESSSIRIHLGAEWSQLVIREQVKVFLRVGHPIGQDLSGIHAGAGVQASGLQVDYGVAKAGILGIVHRITFGISLGGSPVAVQTKSLMLPDDAESTNQILEKSDVADEKDRDLQEVPGADEKDDDSRVIPTENAYSADQYVVWGDFYFEKKEYITAARYYDWAANLAKENAVAWKKLGAAYYFGGLHQDALKAYEEAIRRDSSDQELIKWVENFRKSLE